MKKIKVQADTAYGAYIVDKFDRNVKRIDGDLDDISYVLNHPFQGTVGFECNEKELHELEEEFGKIRKASVSRAMAIVANARRIVADTGRTWSGNDEHVKMVESGKLDSAVRQWLDAVNQSNKKAWDAEYDHREYEPLAVKEGASYYKVMVVENGKNRSAYCFISKKNGDILKPAGWNAVAKHARGNVFDKSSWRNCGLFGVALFR